MFQKELAVVPLLELLENVSHCFFRRWEAVMMSSLLPQGKTYPRVKSTRRQTEPKTKRNITDDVWHLDFAVLETLLLDFSDM